MAKKPPPPDLEHISFLSELPDKRRRFLASRMKRHSYPAGSQIIRQGRKGQFFGLVAGGRVHLEEPDSQPRELGPGDHFGSAMLLYEKGSGYTVTALEDTTLWILLRRDWLAPTLDPPPPKKPLLKPAQTRTLAIGILIAVGLAMFAIILGPTLLDRTTVFLPGWLVDRGRADLAERYLELVTGWQPESARNFGYLGDILVLEEKDEEAIQAYRQALELDEYLPWIHNNLGVLLLEDSQAEAAAEHFQQAIELSPQTIPAYVNLGTAYYHQEDWEAAAAAYGQALELDFSLLDTKAAWAGLIISESRLVEARLVWEDVLLQDPRHPLALQGLGVVSLLEEDPSLAMMYFDAARYFKPDDPALHLYMGMALQELEKPAEAAQVYRFAADNGSNPQLISLARALLEVVLEGDSGENRLH